uniref:Uncharacterized protein n=1 Tax=Hyaloperonospora arabidopsidis (strain Emoy2) TaxID=559515 RepID=M4B1Z3_HYAAE
MLPRSQLQVSTFKTGKTTLQGERRQISSGPEIEGEREWRNEELRNDKERVARRDAQTKTDKAAKETDGGRSETNRCGRQREEDAQEKRSVKKEVIRCVSYLLLCFNVPGGIRLRAFWICIGWIWIASGNA